MNNFIITPVDKRQLYELKNSNLLSAFLIGIKNFSYALLELELNELKEFLSDTNKKIFVNINKLVFNDELEALKNILLELDKLNISGVLFDDLAVYEIAKENNLKLKLIYAAPHLVTNKNMVLFWKKKNIDIVFVSDDITLNDVLEIKKDTKINIIMRVFGYVPIFTSTRHLVESYFQYTNNIKTDNNYYIHDDITNDDYFIYEDNNGTHILSSKALNLIDELERLGKIDYLYLNGINFSRDEFLYVLECFNNRKDKEDMSKFISHEMNKGFSDKKTIFKVKHDE